MSNISVVKIIQLSALAIVSFIALLFLFYIYLFWIDIISKPIPQSQIYRKDFLNNIYYESTSGCLDICLFKSYTHLSNSDGKTFKILTVKNPYMIGPAIIESEFAKDNKHVYFHGSIMPKADPSSFIAIGPFLGKDKLNYFFEGIELKEYIQNNLNLIIKLPKHNLKVISYIPNEYLIIQTEKNYYKLKLNPQPIEILEISPNEALKYTPIN
jgi:hypothetical protein